MGYHEIVTKSSLHTQISINMRIINRMTLLSVVLILFSSFDLILSYELNYEASIDEQVDEYIRRYFEIPSGSETEKKLPCDEDRVVEGGLTTSSLLQNNARNHFFVNPSLLSPNLEAGQCRDPTPLLEAIAIQRAETRLLRDQIRAMRDVIRTLRDSAYQHRVTRLPTATVDATLTATIFFTPPNDSASSIASNNLNGESITTTEVETTITSSSTNGS